MPTNKEFLYSLEPHALTEWFDAEHTSNDTLGAKKVVSAESVDANDANAASLKDSSEDTQNLTDSREKLEADISEYVHHIAGATLMSDRADESVVHGWLDRQAAITERECCEGCDIKRANERQARKIHDVCEGHAELQAQVDELTAERDYWRGQFKRCLCHAIRQEDGDNLDKIMTYPTPEGFIEPYQLVTDEITSLRDFYADTAKRADKLESEVEGWSKRAMQLEGDLKGARDSRDTWRDRAQKAEKSVGIKKSLLKKEREANKFWPRFEDGERVRVGDEVAHYQSGERVKVHFIEFGQYQTKMYGRDQFPVAVCNSAGQLVVKRPPLIAKDGKPIEVGQTLYGESDGKAWEIDRVDQHYAWSGEKRLRPMWLLHERPDSIGEVAKELREYANANLISLGNGQYKEIGELIDLAERLEKIGGEHERLHERPEAQAMPPL